MSSKAAVIVLIMADGENWRIPAGTVRVHRDTYYEKHGLRKNYNDDDNESLFNWCIKKMTWSDIKHVVEVIKPELRH
jgi:hypothetical protein